MILEFKRKRNETDHERETLFMVGNLINEMANEEPLSAATFNGIQELPYKIIVESVDDVYIWETSGMGIAYDPVNDVVSLVGKDMCRHRRMNALDIAACLIVHWEKGMPVTVDCTKAGHTFDIDEINELIKQRS